MRSRFIVFLNHSPSTLAPSLTMRFKVFISSVQSEFAEARTRLSDYIRKDALLCKFFDPFLFEEVPASDRSAREVYLDEVRECDLYVALLGRRFGHEIHAGVSATECEYDLATALKKPRLAFLLDATERDPEERRFISKVEADVVRRSFRSYDELQLAVYAALVRFLEQSGYVRIAPFDMAYDTGLTIEDIDPEKVEDYLSHAREAGKITIPPAADARWILGKLDAVSSDGRLTNAAVLLFAKEPQRKFDSSMVKCLHYWGTRVERPIPSYKMYEGGLVRLIESALEFVMSRIDRTILEPDERGVAPARDELPRMAVREAIVNAVCHRDYESTASVQVMLFKDRLQIINPGSLPRGLTVEDLLTTHDSRPRNKVLAKALDWAGFVERSGHGTEFIIEQCLNIKLSKPAFNPEPETFHTILWRMGYGANEQGGQAELQCGNAAAHDRHKIGACQAYDRPMSVRDKVLSVLSVSARSRREIALDLKISWNAGYLKQTIDALLEDDIIALTIPDKPRSRFQKYRLTDKGRHFVQSQKSHGVNNGR